MKTVELLWVELTRVGIFYKTRGWINILSSIVLYNKIVTYAILKQKFNFFFIIIINNNNNNIN